ncbi:MAG TPA: M56 family metallopeptidase [Planctomycetaceae bacterium]|jgi:beta-lactamase regulating signal transducer with metallopeptidase domain|nr:M56 family metallopeptidase [Planctomycetaceae bacterium]
MIDSMAGSLLIKVTLLLAVALILDGLLRRRWVLTAASFWNAVLISLLVLPLATGLAPRLTLPLLPSDSPNTNRATDSVGVSPRIAAGSLSHDLGMAQSSEPVIATAPIVDRDTLLRVLAGVYGIGVAVCLARLVAGWHAARLLCREAAPVTNSLWLERLESSRSRFGFRPGTSTQRLSRIRLLASDETDVPVVLGVAHPAILIPSRLLEESSVRSVDAILIHELAHVYRADCAWQLLGCVLQAALWMHPLMWLAQRRIAFIRERACDEFSVRMIGDFRDYGETLLDVAAGIRQRRVLGLGLGVVRQSNLARRLAAIADGRGTERCVATPGARRLITAGMLASSFALGSIAFGRSPLEDRKPEANKADAAATPELIALTWQQIPQADFKRIEQPVWRPNGRILPDAEANALLDKLKAFQTHWWNPEKELRPLVLIYRVSTQIRTGFATAVVLPDGPRAWGGTWCLVQDGLAKSSCSPSRRDLKRWPADVDLELQVPLEDPQVIRTIRPVTQEAVNVAPGVRWHLAKKAGTEFLYPGMPAWPYDCGVLEVHNARIDSSLKYGAKIWLRGKKQPLDESLIMTVGIKGALASIRLSRINDPQSIERVEVTRQRFRTERIKDVEIHLDLLPPDP